ncbi:MAG: class I SAM-dependent methyltransferase [Candidatus Krumholzibacteria bacterium]|jgi:SAM-dependent methyltransferase|nr:class I SAM-dependent methyltransferase [Candidatus Krumholzibacteria bacterium]
MRAFVPAKARTLLEIGCGDGAFAEGLRAERLARGQTLEIWGIELEPAIAACANARLDRVLAGPAETHVAALPAGYFDCVVMNDVLEHLAWPEDLLRSLHRVLAPGACLVASIPNVRHFHNVWDLVVRGDWEYHDEGIRDRTHLRFFTRASMRGLFDRAGYRVVEQVGINPTRAWRYRLCNLLALGRLREMRFLQFACVAVPAEAAAP